MKGPRLIVWLRLMALGIGIAAVALTSRALIAIPPYVAFGVAIAAALIWSYRFERS